MDKGLHYSKFHKPFYADLDIGKSNIIAIEADPIAFERLNENLSMNSFYKNLNWYTNISLINKYSRSI